MSLVYSHSASGLVVACQGADEASVRRALKQFDPRLMLDNMIDTAWGRLVWQVLCKTGPDTPPAVVLRWRGPDGEPLPLSHGLVEEAKRLHVASRAPKPDVLEENDRRSAEMAAAADDELDWYGAELADRLRGRTLRPSPRSQRPRGAQFPNLTDIR